MAFRGAGAYRDGLRGAHPRRPDSHIADLILCGGGLQNALIVAALFAAPGLRSAQPAPSVALLERATIGGNHTWCCYASDLSAPMRRQVAPLVSRRWSGYEVRFPGYRRRLHTPYLMIASARLRRVVHDLLAARGDALVWEHAPVARLAPGRVVLEDGRTVAGETVIDARGADRHPTDCGYQKFYGEEVTLRDPHGLQWPLVMDATVPQQDGFRFMYVLPLSPRRALIEDTSFSDGPHLDEEQRRGGIAAWMRRHGWRLQAVTRTERGVLPMPWRMPAPASLPDAGVVRGGYGGGWFHPGTGYSPAAGGRAGSAGGGHPGRPRAGGGRRGAPRPAAARPLLLPAQPAAVPGLPAGGAPQHIRALLSPARAHHPALLQHAPGRRRQGAPARRAAAARSVAAPLAGGARGRTARRRAVTATVAGSGAAPRVAVIGSGFGGLAVAIRLQAAGLATTLFEAREQPGGRAYVWRHQRFTFDMGPTVITDPTLLEDLFAVAGADLHDRVELIAVDPFYRLLWPDGDRFDYCADGAALAAQIGRRNASDRDGYRRFLEYSRRVFATGYEQLAATPFLALLGHGAGGAAARRPARRPVGVPYGGALHRR